MMREEFRRSELLLGPQALERLAGAHAAVFGVGGVGGHAAEALASTMQSYSERLYFGASSTV